MATYKISDISPIQRKQKPKSGQGQGGGEPQDQQQQGQGGGQGDQDQDQQQQQGQGQGKSVDEIHKEIEEKLAGKKDSNESEMAADQQKQKGQSNQPGQGGGSNAGYQKKEVNIKPVYSWKELMRQFVTTNKRPESTYTKPSKRSITGITVAAQTGAGAIKPGEKPQEEAFKLILVFDSSGSMGSAIGVALSEAEALIKSNYENVSGALGVTFFANSPDFFAADLAGKKFWPIPSFNELDKKAPPNKLPLNGLFRLATSGGTDFSTALASQLATMAAKDYNIIIFSDTDIMWGNNWKNFIQLYKGHKKKLFFIADSLNTYQELVKKLGSQPSTFGHF